LTSFVYRIRQQNSVRAAGGPVLVDFSTLDPTTTTAATAKESKKAQNYSCFAGVGSARGRASGSSQPQGQHVKSSSTKAGGQKTKNSQGANQSSIGQRSRSK